MVTRNEGVAFLPKMCVEHDLEQGTLREVRVEELSMERKIRLIYPARRVLSHAAKAFLEIVNGPDGAPA
jgi:DNA-binding transcriptional LysR family regulator